MNNRIMLADDADFMRLVLKDVLTKNGYEVVAEAKDGREAVEMYRKVLPDLILMDVTMPGMDGLAALKIIREFNPIAKVIMCSALGQKAVVFEAIKAGAATFVVKPFDADLLIHTVKKILAQE